MLSTVHDNTMVRVQKYGVWKDTTVVVVTYNQNMGTVDQADQILTAYPMERKRRKVWYKTFLRYLLNQAVLNSYLLHKKLSERGRSLTHFQFVDQLVTRLIEVDFFTYIEINF